MSFSTQIQVIIASTLSPAGGDLHVSGHLDIVVVQGLYAAAAQPPPRHVAIPVLVPGDDVGGRRSLITVAVSAPLRPDLRQIQRSAPNCQTLL